jgi:hypothetical protein
MLGRRTEPAWETRRVSGDDVRVQTAGGEFRPPASLGEWADRVIAQTPADAAGGVLIVILSAAVQGGTRAAVAAVAAAERLSPWDQWFLWQGLEQLHGGGLPDVGPALAEIRREWWRLKLPVSAPSVPPLLEDNRPVFHSAYGGDRYSPSVPDYMKEKR